MTTTKPMTKKEIKEVVAEYAAALIGWQPLADGTALVRQIDVVQQIIAFHALRTGAYRPMHGVRLLVLPDANIGMLPQLLDVRNREATIKQHVTRMPGMLVAMEEQFKPDIRKPLDIAEVFELCKADAQAMQDTTNNMAMLATLAAWLGRDNDALTYCERMQNCSPPMLAPVPERQEAMRAFGRDLMAAMQAGTAREFLKGAIRTPPIN